MLKVEYDNTLNVLRNNRDKLDAIANLLLEKETVTGAEVRELINPMVEGTHVEENHVEESEEMKEITIYKTNDYIKNKYIKLIDLFVITWYNQCIK